MKINNQDLINEAVLKEINGILNQKNGAYERNTISLSRPSNPLTKNPNFWTQIKEKKSEEIVDIVLQSAISCRKKE